MRVLFKARTPLNVRLSLLVVVLPGLPSLPLRVVNNPRQNERDGRQEPKRPEGQLAKVRHPSLVLLLPTLLFLLLLLLVPDLGVLPPALLEALGHYERCEEQVGDVQSERDVEGREGVAVGDGDEDGTENGST